MNLQEIQERVIRVVVDTLNLGSTPEKVTTKSNFIEDLDADSLDTVELVLKLEEEFEIDIPDEDAEKILTVQQAIDYIARVLEITE